MLRRTYISTNMQEIGLFNMASVSSKTEVVVTPNTNHKKQKQNLIYKKNVIHLWVQHQSEGLSNIQRVSDMS